VRLLECLCAVCRIEVASWTPESLLSSVRKLLRDPHSFPSKLISTPHVSGEEAKGLAPFLLSSTQYKRVREKEVNECYDAFSSWLSAFYLFSVVSDEVGPTARSLERQEWLLRRLTGQACEEPAAARSHHVPSHPARVAAPSTVVAPPSERSVTQHSTGSAGSTGVGRSRRVDARASPTGRNRAMLQGGAPPPPRSSPISHRPRTNTESLTSGENQASRSPSPGVRASGSGLRARPSGTSSAASAVPARTSPPPRGGAATFTSAPSRQAQNAEGLQRVQSEKTLTRSPRANRKESRSPSQERGIGTGRASPAAPAPGRVMASRMTPMDRRTTRNVDGRTLSPSQSDSSLPTAQRTERMVSAPADSHRSVTVRTKADAANAARARVGSGYGITGRASAPGVGRRNSPEKSGALRHDGYPDATPRSAADISAKDSARASCDQDGSSADEGDEDFGPRRRRLSKQQYDALVRCAQQVVTVSSMPPAPPPAPTSTSVAAPMRTSPMRVGDHRQRSTNVASLQALPA
jgi:hypothetical protein